MPSKLAEAFTQAAYLLAGVINLLPVTGVLGSSQLTRLYGLPFTDPSLQVLMRHRAILFGLVGTQLAAAAFDPKSRKTAFTTGMVSMVSYMGLVWMAGWKAVNGKVRTVFWVDVVAVLALGAARLLED
ncbi:hypothetical protein HDU96_006382 [Phlyctochytrium bullatum]|nr:hypothetical protein HDU96_006382 [Phlyctochytrium bullatum]